jgi:hypothetical protein
MSGGDKKVIERHYLDAFRRAYPEFPPGSIEDSENPDFLVRAPWRTVGIEVIEYVRGQGERGGSPALRREELGYAVQRKATARYAARWAMPVQVWFSFDRQAPLGKVGLGAVASALVDVVAHAVPPTSPGGTDLHAEDFEGTALEGIIHSVRVLRWPGVQSSCWMYMPGASFVSVPPEEFQALINTKDTKVDAYLANCDHVWLLIVARGGLSLARTATPMDAVRRHVFRSRFHRVFFLDGEGGGVTSLRTHGGDAVWPC